MSIRQDYEAAGMGGFAGVGSGGGLMWVLVLILIFLFFFSKHGEKGEVGMLGGYAIDRDVLLQGSETREKLMANEVNQAEKTRALIEANFRTDQAEKFARQLTTEAELKGRINTLEIERNMDARFAALMGHMNQGFGRVDRELSTVARVQPSWANTVSACTTQVPAFNPCGDFPRRGCGE